MNKQQQEERDAFIVLMVRECKGVMAHDLSELMRLARRHGKMQERACNAPVPENHDALCEARISKVCERIGCVPVFSGDPRGATVKVVVPSGHSNSWGGEGVCVPQ